jgi:hypothetical protein
VRCPAIRQSQLDGDFARTQRRLPQKQFELNECPTVHYLCRIKIDNGVRAAASRISAAASPAASADFHNEVFVCLGVGIKIFLSSIPAFL